MSEPVKVREWEHDRGVIYADGDALARLRATEEHNALVAAHASLRRAAQEVVDTLPGEFEGPAAEAWVRSVHALAAVLGEGSHDE